MLPVNLVAGLERHLQKVKAQFEEDLEEGVGGVYLPRHAVLRGNIPNGGRIIGLALGVSFVAALNIAGGGGGSSPEPATSHRKECVTTRG